MLFAPHHLNGASVKGSVALRLASIPIPAPPGIGSLGLPLTGLALQLPEPLQGRSVTGFLTSGFVHHRYQRRTLTRETDCSKSGKITFCLFASV